MNDWDVIVVGEGLTGLTAARDCAAAGMSTATFEAEMFGGLITSINE
ncbi:MAG: FAD-binding protein, partial [Proteobacteria bacterium]|nr:FAD-binding protein [Burkholderiales bacterium]